MPVKSVTKQYVLYLFFLLGMVGFYLSDGVNKYSRFVGNAEIAIYFRSVYEALLVFALVITLNKRSLSILLYVILLLSIYLLGIVFNLADINYQNNFIIFNKYIFIFLVSAVFYQILETERYVHRISKIFELIIIFNSLLIIVGLVFQIDLLETYAFNNQRALETEAGLYTRFGYSGLIYAQNEVTFIYVLSVVYFYSKYRAPGYALKFWLVLLTAVLLGTKGMYLFLLIFLFYFMKRNAKSFALGTAISISASAFLLIIYNFNNILNYFNYFIVQMESNSLLYVILSGRNHFLISRFLENIDRNPLLLLFGGQDNASKLVELELVDLVSFFGIVGGTIFLYCYYKFVLRAGWEDYNKRVLVTGLIIVAFFSGHFLTSINISFFMLFVLSYFNARGTEKELGRNGLN